MRYVDAGTHHAHRDAGWAPTTQIGRWAAGLAAAALSGVALSIVGFATGVLESADGFTDNWLLTAWAVAILASGAASAVTGALAIFREHDHSRTVLLATLLGACVLALLLNEVAQGLR